MVKTERFKGQFVQGQSKKLKSLKDNRILNFECDKEAVYKIEGYKTIYLCRECGERARMDGYPVISIEE